MLPPNRELNLLKFGGWNTAASRLILFFIACAGGIQILRGIELPNDWSYTHYLTGCEAGFVKRGLIGCIVEKIDYAPLYTYSFFSFAAVLLFVVLVSFISLVFLKAWRRQKWPTAVGVLVFICSPSIIFISNLIGYYDFIGAILLLLTLTVSRLSAKLSILVLGFFILAFIHEGAVVIFLPLAFVCFLISAVPSREPKAWIAAALFGMFIIFGALLTVANFKITHEMADLIFEGIKLKADHNVDPSVMDVFQRDVYKNRELVFQFKSSVYFEFFWRLQFWFEYGAAALVFSAGSMLILARAGLPWSLRLLCLASPYAVYTLAFVAYDFHRWLSWSVFCSFILYLWLLTKYRYAVGGRSILAVPFLFIFCVFQGLVIPVFLNPRETSIFHIFELIRVWS